MTVRPARGERNNNPGNIRYGDNWAGMADLQLDPEFVTFAEPVWGIRALAKVLLTYCNKHGLKSPWSIINRWAPPTENNTAAYVMHVCGTCGWISTQEIDMNNIDDLRKMTVAIIEHELGYQPYDPEVIETGITWALGS